jgi:hypothetical protein
VSDAFDYIESRDDADELIKEFGAAVSLRRSVNTGTVFDPTITITDYPTFAARVEFTLKQLQGGNVLDTDERWLVAAGPLDSLGIVSVESPDALNIGGVSRPILIAKPLSPAGVTVLYDCQIRF